MRASMFAAVALIAPLGMTACVDDSSAPTGQSESALARQDCDVAIIGGGPGGVHTAYKLTTMHLTAGPVCLFEKSDHLGGRVGNNHTVGLTTQPFVNGGVAVERTGQTGTGGYRMYNSQYTYQLGQELAALGRPGQLSFLAQRSFSVLSAVANRGYNPSYGQSRYFTYSSSELEPLYHSPVSDDDLWTAMLCGPQVPTDANHYPQYENMTIPGLNRMSAREYLQWVARNVVSHQYGPQVAQYMLDAWRFRADFKGAIDAVSYLDFNAHDFNSGSVVYPIPSFQPYFDIMQQQILASGGRISFEEAVVSVNTRHDGDGYVLRTSRGNKVFANTVVIATPHAVLQQHRIIGDVIDRITDQAEFSAIEAASAITVTHQYGDGHSPNSGWWHQDIRFTGSNLLGAQLAGDAPPLLRSTNNFMIPGDRLPGCHRDWCDFTDTRFYNNTNEISLTDYHDFINVSRDVYNDDPDAVDNWVRLYDAGEQLSPGGGGNAAVNAQIVKSLRLMYPSVFTGNPAHEPRVRSTQVTVHKPAWYNLREGAFKKGFTNASILDWSQSPLPGEPVYLVGDSWNNNDSGWSDAAYQTSVYMLNSNYGTSIDPRDTTRILCIDGAISYP